MATAVAEPQAKPNLKDVPVPYVVERCLLMTAGRWNDVDFPASAIAHAAQKLVADKKAMVRLFEGATTDHQDSTGTLIGHSENHEWDGKTLWGDCVFIVENAARIAKYQKETKLQLEGISPRMTTQPEWKPANGRIDKVLEFKSFGIVLDPAQGAQAMLSKDSKGRTMLGDGPVVLLETADLPFPNEHAARLQTPESLTPFIRIGRTSGSGEGTVQGVKVPESIDVIWYIVKREDKEVPVAQALRFPIQTWTEADAKAWLKKNEIKHILFEPASGSEQSNLDKTKKEVSEVKKLFCEKCDLLFDKGTEKCSKCGGALKAADEATVTRLEEKVAKEAQEKKDAEALAQKKKDDEAAEALAQKKKDDEAAEALAAKQGAVEFPEATHTGKPWMQGPNGYKHPYYGKAEGEFHKEPTKVRTHVLSRKPALDQVADLEELTQDFVGFCGSVLKSHIEGKLELSQAIVEMTAMLREIPLSAELSKEEIPMDDAYLEIVKENQGHRAAELTAEIALVCGEGSTGKFAPAVKDDVEALLSVASDAVLSEEGVAIDVAGHFRNIVKSLPKGATLDLDEKTKRLVSTEATLSKQEKTAEAQRQAGADLVPKHLRKTEATT